jgi:hypothetical protein
MAQIITEMAETIQETNLNSTSDSLMGDPSAVVPRRDQRSLIQWTTEQQIQEVSKKLAKVNQVAIRSEANGDYFKSGDLAYQIRQIIQATAELFNKSRRVKGESGCYTEL